MPSENRPDPDNWPTVVCLGELLVDFVALDVEVSLDQATTFQRAPGGAPANVSVALARLGYSVGFIGKVGGDLFGRRLRATLEQEGVDVRGLVETASASTALAFIGSDGHAGRRFVFYHQGMAHTLLRSEEVDEDLIAHASIFHFGSVTLAAEPSRSATFAAARHARERQHQSLVSFDPNVRLEVWESADVALQTIRQGLGLADVVKVSADEVEFLTGTTDTPAACRVLRGHGPAVAVVTMGGSGAYYQTAAASGYVPGVAVAAVDSLGAGDAFMAGLLARASDLPDVGILHDEEALVGAIRFGNAVGAITTTQYGAIPALPTRAQVDRLLAASAPL